MLELRARIEDIYARHTGQSIEQIHEDMERDRFFSAEDAVEYGLVDRVIAEHELHLAKGRQTGRARPASRG